MPLRGRALPGDGGPDARHDLPLRDLPPGLRLGFPQLRALPQGPLHLTAGEPTRYRSSAFAERGFCVVCGSTLSMHEEVLGDRVQVTLGSLDRPEDVRPDDHVWTQSQLPWLEVADDLPRFRQSTDAVPSRATEEPEG